MSGGCGLLDRPSHAARALVRSDSYPSMPNRIPATKRSKSLEGTADLILKARGGDASAENEIFRRNLPELRRWARGKLPSVAREVGDTEDLVQDTVLSALRRLSSFDPECPGAFQRYLRVSLKNRVRDELRRTKRRPPAEPIEETSHDGPSPLDQAMARETRQRYQRGLALLRPTDRALVIAWLERQWDYSAIGRGFGKPTPDAARMAVRRALQRLVQAMAAAASSSGRARGSG
jgi:RNA polymerase sigma factor (sigma-70 family)